jgi:tetratricopeptide (TPR) repeat protein
LELLRAEAQQVLQTSVPAPPEAVDKAPGPEQPKTEAKQPDQTPRDSAVTPPPKLKEPNIYLDQAGLYVALGRYEAALGQLEKAMGEPDTNLVKVHRKRCNIYREMKQFDKAIAACNEALQLEPDNAEILMELGNCYLFKGDLDQAIIAYSKFIDLPDQFKPDWLRSHAVRRRGEVYALLGEHDKALQDFERALELEPDGEWNCGCFAQFLAHCADPSYRDFERAVELAHRSVALRPDIGKLWGFLGGAQLRQGDLSAALASLQKAEELGWDTPFLLAMVQHRLGNTEQARRYFELGEQRLREDFWKWGTGLQRQLRDEAAELLGIAQTLRGNSSGEDKKTEPRKLNQAGNERGEADEGGPPSARPDGN